MLGNDSVVSFRLTDHPIPFPPSATQFSTKAQIFLRTLEALPGTSSPMTTEGARLHTPAGIFVIHLRSDSDPSQQQLIGRIEHVMSGNSEAFVSLHSLLAFMNRYAVPQDPKEAAHEQR